MATLAQKDQVLVGAVGFIPIQMMNRSNEGVAVLPPPMLGYIAPLHKLHPTLLTLMVGPGSHLRLDQPTLP